MGNNEEPSHASSRMRAAEAAEVAASPSGKGAAVAAGSRPVFIVLITGFESFNLDLYNRAAEMLRVRAPGTQLKVCGGGIGDGMGCDLIIWFHDEDARLSMREVLSLLQVFSDRDLTSQRSKVEAALAGADVFFGSLLFDFDQVTIGKRGHVLGARTV